MIPLNSVYPNISVCLWSCLFSSFVKSAAELSLNSSFLTVLFLLILLLLFLPLHSSRFDAWERRGVGMRLEPSSKHGCDEGTWRSATRLPRSRQRQTCILLFNQLVLSVEPALPPSTPHPLQKKKKIPKHGSQSCSCPVRNLHLSSCHCLIGWRDGHGE